MLMVAQAPAPLLLTGSIGSTIAVSAGASLLTEQKMRASRSPSFASRMSSLPRLVKSVQSSEMRESTPGPPMSRSLWQPPLSSSLPGPPPLHS